MDNIWPDLVKQIASLGLAGIAIIALVFDRKALIADRKAAEAEVKEAIKKHAAEMESFHQRYEAKAENWASHLSEIAAKNQENDAKTVALLEGLLRALKKKGATPEP